MSSSTDVLMQTDLFSSLTPQECEMLALLIEPREFEAGQPLFRAGEHGDYLAVVTRGELEVRVEGADRFTVHPGEVIGEMNALDPAPRSAEVVATEASEVWTIDQKMLRKIRAASPRLYTAILDGVARRVTDRLRSVNEAIEDRYPSSPVPAGAPAGRVRAPERYEGEIDLRELDELRDFDDESLEILAKVASFHRYGDGVLLCREGDEADRCYMVLKGEVEIRRNLKGQQCVLGAVGPGALLGQAALIKGGPRTAALLARGTVVTLEIARDVFELLRAMSSPLGIRFQELIAVQAVRQLRSANERLAQIPSVAAPGMEAERSSPQGFERQDTVRRFLDSELMRSGISVEEIDTIDFNGPDTET